MAGSVESEALGLRSLLLRNKVIGSDLFDSIENTVVLVILILPQDDSAKCILDPFF